jgi:hypothetical protein
MASVRVVIQKPINGSISGVQSVNGDGVNNTDPLNPILSFPNADEVDDSSTTNKFATGTNTGDETTSSIQNKRPLKTVGSESLEGTGDIAVLKQGINTLTQNTTIEGGVSTSFGVSIGDINSNLSDLEISKDIIRISSYNSSFGGASEKTSILTNENSGLSLNLLDVASSVTQNYTSLNINIPNGFTLTDKSEISPTQIGEIKVSKNKSELSCRGKSISFDDTEAIIKNILGRAIKFNSSSDYVNIDWRLDDDYLAPIKTIKENTKTIQSFPTQQTTAFTVADNSDRFWHECDFAAETEVTITVDSVGVIGEIVYFSLKGDGPIKFVESGVTISFNAEQSLVLGSKGDKIALVKTGATTYEIV